MIAIYRREMRSYFQNVIGYVILAVLLLAAGVLCTIFNVVRQSAYFSDTLYYLQFALALVVPLLTMRSLTEERKNHTDQLLYSLPIPLWKIVLGKYLAMLSVLGLGCLVIAVYPLLLSLFGMGDFSAAYSMLFGFFLLGAALIALSMLLSSLTDNLIVSIILSVLGMAALYVIDTFVMVLVNVGAVGSLVILIALALLVALAVLGFTKNLYFSGFCAAILVVPQVVIFAIDSSLYDSLAYRLARNLSLFYRYEVFSKSIFDLTSIVYYISFAALFLYATWQMMERRRRV
jgi:ABC-2 type transport system permease protein